MAVRPRARLRGRLPGPVEGVAGGSARAARRLDGRAGRRPGRRRRVGRAPPRAGAAPARRARSARRTVGRPVGARRRAVRCRRAREPSPPSTTSPRATCSAGGDAAAGAVASPPRTPSDLGAALADSGRAEETEALLSEAVEQAHATGSERDALRARLQLLSNLVYRSPTEVEIESAVAETRSAADAFEAMGDDVGLAEAAIVGVNLEYARAHCAAGCAWASKALRHAPRRRSPAGGHPGRRRPSRAHDRRPGSVRRIRGDR